MTSSTRRLSPTENGGTLAGHREPAQASLDTTELRRILAAYLEPFDEWSPYGIACWSCLVHCHERLEVICLKIRGSG